MLEPTRRYRPYSRQRRSTNAFVAASIANSFGQTRTSSGLLAVASKPILLPAPKSGVAWSLSLQRGQFQSHLLQERLGRTQ